MNVEAWAADKTTEALIDLAGGASQVLAPVARLCLRDRAQGGDDEARAWLNGAGEEASTGQATSEPSPEVESEALLIYQGAVALLAAGSCGGLSEGCVDQAAHLLELARAEARERLA